jgi:hypothetical protein
LVGIVLFIQAVILGFHWRRLGRLLRELNVAPSPGASTPWLQNHDGMIGRTYLLVDFVDGLRHLTLWAFPGDDTTKVERN